MGIEAKEHSLILIRPPLTEWSCTSLYSLRPRQNMRCHSPMLFCFISDPLSPRWHTCLAWDWRQALALPPRCRGLQRPRLRLLPLLLQSLKPRTTSSPIVDLTLPPLRSCLYCYLLLLAALWRKKLISLCLFFLLYLLSFSSLFLYLSFFFLYFLFFFALLWSYLSPYIFISLFHVPTFAFCWYINQLCAFFPLKAPTRLFLFPSTSKRVSFWKKRFWSHANGGSSPPVSYVPPLPFSSS